MVIMQVNLGRLGAPLSFLVHLFWTITFKDSQHQYNSGCNLYWCSCSLLTPWSAEWKKISRKECRLTIVFWNFDNRFRVSWCWEQPCYWMLCVCVCVHVKMPEEQAFCVLVTIMYQYGLRNLFRQGFEELHLKFYQLERLIQVLHLAWWQFGCCCIAETDKAANLCICNRRKCSQCG